MPHSSRSSLGFALLLELASACGGGAKLSPDVGGGSGNGASGSAQAGQSTGGGGAAGTYNGGAAGDAGGPSIDIGPQQTSSKLDVLFVVDNSSSMAGKQRILATSIPGFVTQMSALSHDIHFGVITTSIGAHGGTSVCQPSVNAHNDDQAQLLPSKRDGLASYMGLGFLSFDAAGLTGASDTAQISLDLAATINAAGEDGCGYEAPLEAMYRFLVDPDPPVSVDLQQQQSTPSGINDALLTQRSAFLRPDSSVAILFLSDENDCSIMDTGLGWFMTSSSRMPLSTSACEVNPNDPCCRSCAQLEVTP
ncbi:MAG: vWA domain-containing protein, partial [Polyangiaceae bacterium]